MKVLFLIVTAAMLSCGIPQNGMARGRQIPRRPVPDPARVRASDIDRPKSDGKFATAADQVDVYLPYLKGKRVAMVINQTSVIGKQSSVDSLRRSGVNLVKIFGPEHGFRGNASAGVTISDYTDPQTGIPVVSLYGKKTKPSKADLENVDLVIFDIQDVGARFYTNINVLEQVMESCAENDRELMILDRPNPNGYLVDGPVLDMKLKSGVGMFPIPIAHGMTIAEFAQMINGEGWIPGGLRCRLKIIRMKNYTHQMDYVLPVKPSPNLNTQQSILLYPSLCLFEGTVISQGRGTLFPFTVLGNPKFKGKYAFSFIPKSIPGMSETPLHMGLPCYGIDLRNYNTKKLKQGGKLNLGWLMELYKAYPEKERFFDYTQSKEMGNFDKLAGTEELRAQIIAGKTERVIRDSWEPALSQFRFLRHKYLLYD